MTPGKVQEYRVHRISTSSTGKAPARSTLHDEIVTLPAVIGGLDAESHATGNERLRNFAKGEAARHSR